MDYTIIRTRHRFTVYAISSSFYKWLKATKIGVRNSSWDCTHECLDEFIKEIDEEGFIGEVK